MLCPSDEDWLSQPTDNLLSSWARPLGGCRWDSVGGPWNPLLLAQLHLLTLRRPPQAPPPPIKEAGPCRVSAFNPYVHSLFLSNTLRTPGPHCAHQASEPHGPEVVKGLCSPPGDQSSQQRNQIASLRVIFFPPVKS